MVSSTTALGRLFLRPRKIAEEKVRRGPHGLMPKTNSVCRSQTKQEPLTGKDQYPVVVAS